MRRPPWCRRALRRLAGWAVGRAIAPNSLTGISLLLALCAAAWFSGGPGADSSRGLLAMGGWLLAMTAAGRLAAFTPRHAAARPGRPARLRFGQRCGRRGSRTSSTDWLVLPDVVWVDDAPAGGSAYEAPRGRAGGGLGVAALPAMPRRAMRCRAMPRRAMRCRGGSTREASAEDVSPGDVPAGADEPGRADAPDEAEPAAGARGFGWLSAVCAVAAECAIYGGIAAGGKPTALIGMWPLAVMTVVSVAVTDLLGACRVAAVQAGRCRELGRSPGVQRWTGRLLCPPVGARALIAAAGFAVGGPQAALFAVLAVEVTSFAITLAMLARIALPGTWPGVSPVPRRSLGGLAGAGHLGQPRPRGPRGRGSRRSWG